jgi:hypothetical protein
VVVDVRGGKLFSNLDKALAEVKKDNWEVRVLFLEASDVSLVRRFEGSRRPHPLQGDGRVLDGLQNIEKVVESFWKTFHWTIEYFIENKSTNWNWAYMYPDAPLIMDILEFYETSHKSEKHSMTLSKHLAFILPCKYCRNSFTKYSKNLPVDGYLDSRSKLTEWVYLMHNKVNGKLRRQGFLDSPNPSFKEVNEKAFQFYTKFLSLKTPLPFVPTSLASSLISSPILFSISTFSSNDFSFISS